MSKHIDLIFSSRQSELIQKAVFKRFEKIVGRSQFIMGEEVAELERTLANYTGFKNAIACANGTDALTLALMAHDVGKDDVIFSPSFTYVATAEAIAVLGAIPFFVEVGNDYLIDLESLSASIADAKAKKLKIRGIISVDLFGLPANHSQLRKLADEHGMFLISDGAQSFGAKLDDKAAGLLANVTTTSFFPTKPLGCWGDGGMLFTNNDDIATRLRSMTFHGKGDHKYHHINIGMNSRLDSIQAAVLLEKFKYFPDEIVNRRKLANFYTENLKDIIPTPQEANNKDSAWGIYQLAHSKRDAIINELGNNGIPSGIYYPTPLHLQPAYKHYPYLNDLDLSERFSKEVFCLPMHGYIEKNESEYIVATLKKILKNI